MPVAASGSRDETVAKERQGLDALRTGDPATFARPTAKGAVFIDAHGIASKPEVMKNGASFQLRDYSMDDVTFTPLSASSGMISYKINEEGNSHGMDFSAKAYVSSIWDKRDRGWVCVFSQETATK